jgi:hypothetical protein
LPVDSLTGNAEGLVSANSLQHIVTQPGSLAAAASAAVPAGVQLRTPLPADSMGAIAHMSPVVPSPFSEGAPDHENRHSAVDAMQRLPTAPQLPPPEPAGEASVAAPELDARRGIASASILPAVQHPKGLEDGTMWPDPLYVPDNGSPPASEPALAPADPSSMQLPAPFALHSLPPAALLPDPDVKRNGDSGRLTPSPKKARLMWPLAGAASPGRMSPAATPDRHAYTEPEGDWLSEPESSVESTSSRLAKRPRQV